MKFNQSKFMHRRSDRLFPIHPNNLNKVIQGEWNIITKWLCDVLSSGDIMCEINSVFTTIQRFINIFGMRLSKTQRIALIRLTVAYICCPNIDMPVVFNALELLNKLISKSHSLPSSTLSVNWRDFLDMREWIDNVWEVNFHSIQLPKMEYLKLQQITTLCSKFFPKSSIEEVWLEFRHHICSDLLTGAPNNYLNHFLVYTPFYPKYFDEISRVWLTDIFDLWYMHPEFGNFREIIRILCYVSRIGRGRIDWEPHMERIFTGLSRAITLSHKPVHGESLKTEDIEYYAELMMNTIGPDRSDCPSSTLYRLEQLLKSVESFYHPSTSQMDAAKLLSCFMLEFLHCLIYRLRDELFPPMEALDLGYTPPEFYLSVEQVNQVVDLFTPICLDYFLYSKFDAVVNNTVKIISLLCKLRPSRVMPCLIDNLDAGLSKLEMPLRFTRPLQALTHSVQSLIYVRFPLYPHGPSLSSSNVHSGNDDFDTLEHHIDDDDDVEEEEDVVDADGANEYDNANNGIDTGDGDDKEMMKEEIDYEQVDDGDDDYDESDRGDEEDLFTSSSSSSSASSASDVDNHKANNSSPPTRPVNHANGKRTMKKRILKKVILFIDSLKFLSTPIWNTSTMRSIHTNHTNPNDLITEKIITELNGIEDTVFMLYEHILTYLSRLNDDSMNLFNAQHSTHLSHTIYRPQTGSPRSYIDTCQMSRLTGLCIALSLSTSSNVQLRCRLINLLIDKIFSCQWSPETSRLIGYQAYWLSVDSSYNNNSSSSISSSIYALKLIWPKFMAIVNEIENDASFVYHHRAEPRLLSLLYILPGFICALPPENLIDPIIYEEFIQPLIILLGKLCYLSTGCLVKPDWNQLTCMKSVNAPSMMTLITVNACPALSEASASFLAMLLHRLTSYSIDLRHLNLLDNIVGIDDEQQQEQQLNKVDAFISSPWWSPFVNLKSIVKYCYNHKSRKYHSFWFKPTSMTTNLARQLVKTFLYPIIEQLEVIHANLTSLLHSTTSNDNVRNGINYMEQRNQFTSLTIWMNHLMNALSDTLAPRTKKLTVNEIRIGENFMPWHGLSNLIDPHEVYNVPSTDDLQQSSVSDWDVTYFYMSSKNDPSEELRETALKIGLKLLDVISQLIKETDDNLIDCYEKTDDYEIIDSVLDNSTNFDTVGVSEKSNDCNNSTTKSIWLLFNNVQIYNLIEFTQQALLNLPMEEHRPYLLQILNGPQSLLSSDLGARNCLHLSEQQQQQQQQCTRSNDFDKYCIPSINSLTGTYCSPLSTSPPPSSASASVNQNESNENLQMYFGCSIITHIARIHQRFSMIKLNHLRKYLTVTVKNSTGQCITHSLACSPIIQPSIEMIKFAEILTVLATSPHRSDIRRLANFILNGSLIKCIPSIGSKIVESLVNRLNNIMSDIKYLTSSPHSSSLSSLTSIGSSSSPIILSTIGSLEAKQKLIHHRRMSTIIALKQIYARHHWNREFDELLRLDPSLFVQFCTSLIEQLVNYETEKSIWFKSFKITNSNNNSDSMSKSNLQQQQHQLKQLQTNRDNLECLIKQILQSFQHFPIDFYVYLSFNRQLKQIPPTSSSWLSKVYSEVDHCLHTFQCSINVQTSLNHSNHMIDRLFENRNQAMSLFTRNISDYIIRIHSIDDDYQPIDSSIDFENITITDHKTTTTNNHHHHHHHNTGTSTSWSLTVTLLKLLRYPLSPPFTPVWKLLDNNYSLPPPIFNPPSLKFIEIVFSLMISEQTEVAFTACRCISELLYNLIGRYRIPSRQCISPIEICQNKLTSNNTNVNSSILPTTHHHPNMNSPIVAGPRPDNLWLLFNENARILESDQAYQSHHHVVSLNCGFVYYPVHLYIYNPYANLPYPTFDHNGQLIAENRPKQINTTTIGSNDHVNSSINSSDQFTSWLSHLIIIDNQQNYKHKQEELAYLLASKLCSPTNKQTQQFWSLLAKHLLYIHRFHAMKQQYYGNIIHDFIKSCLLSFGPENMFKHLAHFIETLLMITLPNSKLPLDGKAEFISFYWIQIILTSLINLSSIWSRQWKYYFWRLFIPKILCWSEIAALNVSIDGLAQSIDEKLHPTVRHVPWIIPSYAGKFAGGRDEDDDDDGDIAVDDCHKNFTAAIKSNDLSSGRVVKQSLAGGPYHRIYFMYDYVINCATSNANLDIHCLHPLWDWAIQGLIESNHNDNGNDNHSAQCINASCCQHGLTMTKDDDCPSCILIQHLPLVHRRVFYERLCYKFVFSLGWLGIPLYKHLLSYQPSSSSLSHRQRQHHSTVFNSSDRWYSQACNNSVWLRDLSASHAVYRVLPMNNLISNNNKINLNIITYKSKQTELICLSKQLSINDIFNYQLFIRDLFQIDDQSELLGGEFLLKSFLPLIVRDTLNVLRLKRINLSQSSLMLSTAPPEYIHSSVIQEVYKNTTTEATTDNGSSYNNSDNNNNNHSPDHNVIGKKNYRLSEIIVLSNRLYCLYSCLRVLLNYSCPTFPPPQSPSSPSTLINEENSIQTNQYEYSMLSRTKICCLLAPLLADICSMGNAYDYFTCALNMKIFQNTHCCSLSRKHNYAKINAAGAGDDDDMNDGLICGISAYLIYISALPLSGQGQSNNLNDNILSFIEEFLQHFLQHRSWRTRAIGLLLLRNFIVFNVTAFHSFEWNLSLENTTTTTTTTLNNSVNKRLKSILWKCLNDSMLELSQVAMFVLAIFIEVGVIKYDKKWVGQLIRQINRTLPKQTSMPINPTNHSDHHTQPTNFSDNNNNNHEYAIALRDRYAAILALCSFVHGNPHQTPDYLPLIISELANHLHDSQSIKKVISSTLSTYSRSHQDVWHEQSLKFTPEQLDNYKFVISDASYYV
ncbi:unnamed protein product [Schistosoma turkestanicum]|nr:unnamed protein product [Schistosoma turkestanicum]